MAYTNATIYMDYVNGSDAALTTLTSCIASNPSGTITRINKTSHGLTTGQIVYLSGFTAWLNTAWKVTVVDANNFDLDDAVWQATADNNGSVTPFRGYNWTNAIKTITNAFPAGRLNGSTIRVAKSPDPVSIGNATWTSRSATVTLATAQTTTIDNCETAWTAANSATSVTSTTRKEGANSAQITTSATTAINTKYAYRNLGTTLNLSTYNSITFWFQPTNSVSANHYQIKLCSDTTGDTAVDTFDIPVVPSTGQWVCFTLQRVGGGNLGSSIQSIALYTGSSNPGNSRVIKLDNISAANSTGLSLTSLISKNSSAYTNPETSDTWHGLQSLDGTTVVLGLINSTLPNSSALYGYYTNGTSPETVTTYIRQPLRVETMATSNISSTNILLTNDSGTPGNLIFMSGGWNTSTNTQDGETWFDGGNGYGYLVQGFQKDYYGSERINGTRLYSPFASGASQIGIGLDITGIACNCLLGFSGEYTLSSIKGLANNNQNPVSLGGNANVYPYFICESNQNNPAIGGGSPVVNNLKIYNGEGLNANGTSVYIENLDMKYITASAIRRTGGGADLVINKCTLDNATSGTFDGSYSIVINDLTATNISTMGSGGIIVKNMNSASTQLIGSSWANYTTTTISQPVALYSNINGDANDNRSFWSYGNALSQTTERHTASGVAWQINITNSAQDSDIPLLYPIAKVACNANSLVTVKAWVKKSHATDIAAQLFMKAYEIAGVTSSVSATKSSDTNWEELTITFTPTLKGVVDVYIKAWWVANTADESIYVDDITVTQA